jgi:hypothetical protein
MDTIELKTATVHLREDGIMHVHIKEGHEMQLTDAIQVVEAMGELSHQQKTPVLVDCGEFSSVDKEVRIFSASKEANIYTTAEAVAYHSFAHKLLAHFYVTHNKPAIPTKVFPDNESAIEWLKEFSKEKSN